MAETIELTTCFHRVVGSCEERRAHDRDPPRGAGIGRVGIWRGSGNRTNGRWRRLGSPGWITAKELAPQPGYSNRPQMPEKAVRPAPEGLSVAETAGVTVITRRPGRSGIRAIRLRDSLGCAVRDMVGLSCPSQFVVLNDNEAGHPPYGGRLAAVGEVGFGSASTRSPRFAVTAELDSFF